MSSATTTAGAIVCPFIADFDVDSRLNITSSTHESVTISNIDHTVTAAAVDLKAAFDCSGWGINKLLTENQELIGSLVVSLPESGAALKSILSAALVQGDVETYLEAQYDAAFQQAFPTFVKDVSGADADVNGPANTPVPGGLPVGGVTDASYNQVLSASLVTQTSTLSSYSFNVDISGGEGADAMYAGLTEARLNSLFMQLPYARLLNAVDAAGDPVTRELPLSPADSITFVFDINVTASTDPNTSNANDATPNGAAATDAPAANADNTVQSVQMDLGSRRIAIVIPQA